MLSEERLSFRPLIPQLLAEFNLRIETATGIEPSIQSQFPHLMKAFKPAPTTSKTLRVGILFSGGPAAGGHNVIAGVFDAMPLDGELIGFLNGPAGLIDNKFKLLGEDQIDPYRNQGGFDLIGTGRTKIETPDQFAKSLATVQAHKLDGLIIVGGDDSNTNAAFLAEYFLAQGIETSVVGVPKTIDGDLKNRWVEISFGFDSAAKTYSEFIGNVLRDALSQRKYYFFIKVMGRTASHLVLECALQTQPNLTLISEEIKEKKWTLKQVIQQISNLIVERAEVGKDYGVLLIPEGIIEFIPEIKQLIKELNANKLSSEMQKLFQTLPEYVQKQLTLDRDPHGNVQVSKIETERLFIDLVAQELKNQPQYNGPFSAQPLFCGYEGRSCLPSNFDCNYCYALGLTASLLVKQKATGYMATLAHLTSDPANWEPLGIPLIAMLEKDETKGKTVIHKELVNLQAAPFSTFASQRDSFRLDDLYQHPGPIQFFGPAFLTDRVTETLKLEETNSKSRKRS